MGQLRPITRKESETRSKGSQDQRVKRGNAGTEGGGRYDERPRGRYFHVKGDKWAVG